MIERGTIEQINGRGRVTVRLADRVVMADLHSGSGGCIGDLVEGEMGPGVRSWRNVGNSILSVVQVVAVHALSEHTLSEHARSQRALAEHAPTGHEAKAVPASDARHTFTERSADTRLAAGTDPVESEVQKSSRRLS